MEIIIEGFPHNDQILLDEITCKYVQDADCTEDRDNYTQEIVLSSRDGGGGKFINIKTESWSINGDNLEDDLIPLIEDFKKRMSKYESVSNT